MAVTTHEGPRPAPKPRTGEDTAHGLALFSIGLGLLEIFGARTLAGALGLRGSEAVLRGYGVREVVSGVAILATGQKAPAVWARVAGDAIDIATLQRGLTASNPKRGNLIVALAAVVGVTIVDAWCAAQLSMPRRGPPVPHYGNRSGYPGRPSEARGAARRDGFETPRDMRAALPDPR
jgi:hypothetical protein